jgi:hypothetical protein
MKWRDVARLNGLNWSSPHLKISARRGRGGCDASVARLLSLQARPRELGRGVRSADLTPDRPPSDT